MIISRALGLLAAAALLATGCASWAGSTPSLDAESLDLPLVEVPAERQGDLFAVLVTGDGGWASFDRQLAAELAARGIPVVGLDSLRYFWNERTPDGFAADLDRVLRVYSQRWAKRRALVIGYSQGADVLPFALGRIASDTRALLARAVLLAPSLNASFEVHLTNWFGGNDGNLPVAPEIDKLDPERLVCIYGVDDDAESPCRALTTGVRVRPLPGGHHFNRAYAELVGEITDGMSW